jgi:hypothetical protein
MHPQMPPYPTRASLTCKCGKSISGDVPPAASWEQNADLAEKYGWLPVIVGDAVGASTGSHHYACSRTCQQEWLASLR